MPNGSVGVRLIRCFLFPLLRSYFVTVLTIVIFAANHNHEAGDKVAYPGLLLEKACDLWDITNRDPRHGRSIF